jgi:pimeloyl-ACP methyl ester carboxylesterase
MTTPSKHADNIVRAAAAAPGQEKYHLDVVFVHGLGSSAAAWVNKNGFNWPTALEQSDPHLRVLNIEYDAPMFNHKDASAVKAQYEAIAINFLAELRGKRERVTKRPIVFVAHSLGGIVVKHALRLAEHHDKKILKDTRCVVFLSTPHSGAAIANAAGYLGPGVRALGALASKVFSPIVLLVTEPIARRVGGSVLTSQLEKNDRSLLDLNYWYRSLRHIETHVFYETELTNRFVHVVDPASADPGVPGCLPIGLTGKDHISICKPKDKNDSPFVNVATIIKNVELEARKGQDYPVCRDEIHEILVANQEFARFRDAGNFEDIPIKIPSTPDAPELVDIRRRVEKLLRARFEARFESGESMEVSQERQIGDSPFDIDKFVLLLWLERKATEQLKTLSTFLAEAESSVRANINQKKHPTLILLYRAARTIDHVLVEFDYHALETSLQAAYLTVNAKHKNDNTFDGDGKTQRLLEKLIFVARGFDDAKRAAPPPAAAPPPPPHAPTPKP